MRSSLVVRGWPLVAGLIAALLAAGALSAPALSRPSSGRTAHAPALKMIWGPVQLPNGRSAFPTYHRLGVQVFEIDLLWSQVAVSRPANAQDPRDPAYHWPAQIDEAI